MSESPTLTYILFVYINSETAGHIPGAKNFPISSIVDKETGVLKSMDELNQCEFYIS